MPKARAVELLQLDDREQPEDTKQPVSRSSDPEVPFADQVPMARPIQGAVIYSTAIAAPPAGGSQAREDQFFLTGSSRASAWIDVGVGFAILLLFFVAPFGIQWFFSGETPTDPPNAAIEGRDEATATAGGSLILMLAIQAVIAIGVVVGILKYRRQTAASLGLSWTSLPLNGLVGVGAMAACYALIFPTMLGLFAAFPEVMDQMVENGERLKVLLPKMPIWAFVVIATLVGTYEEITFRGFLMTRLRRGTNSWLWAVLLSTAVFTAPHALEQTPSALIMISILSIIMSVVTIWRRSIIPAIVGHTLFNLFQFIGLHYGEELAEYWERLM